MKILFVACKNDYGKPELGLSFEYYNIYEPMVHMNSSAHNVIYFPFDEIALKYGKEEMNKKLLETVKVQKPDLCFFFLFGNEIEKDTIKKITDFSTITFNWFADDKWRFENFSKLWAPAFSWVSTDQPERLKDYYKIGYKNVIVGGWACNHNLYKPLDVPKKYDVTFIGQPHGDRKKIVNAIKKAGINIECFGRGWPNGKVSQEEMIKIFNQSKINLNFSKCSGSFGLKYLARIFVDVQNGKIVLKNPATWWGNLKSLIARSQNEIKGRNFEIPGCNAFLISGYAKGLENFYELEKEVVCFQNTKDLIKKIKYYLEHEDEREAIAKAAYERTLKDHTYEKRLNDIFAKIFTNK